jgi:hypothetical protein
MSKENAVEGVNAGFIEQEEYEKFHSQNVNLAINYP